MEGDRIDTGKLQQVDVDTSDTADERALIDSFQQMDIEPVVSVFERLESQVIPTSTADDQRLASDLDRAALYKRQFDAVEDLPPGLLMAVATVESSGDPAAIGPKTRHGQAKGMMQLMEKTARSLGMTVDEDIDERFDPVKSINAAGQMLREALQRSGGDIDQALMQYNWGSGRWASWLNEEPGFEVMPDETRRYLGRVRSVMAQLAQL
ncbi:hypothetical protein CMI37_23965 [Candidatus Pacearchaeota archaeon]|nr:hypothetical protein [Candidatus Pacearchaeota archaeon]